MGRETYEIHWNGEHLTTWELPSSHALEWGMLLAIPYRGRLKLFRAVGMTTTQIIVTEP